MINKINVQRRLLERSLIQLFKNFKEKIKLKIELVKNKIRLFERIILFCKFLFKYGIDFEILSLKSLVMRRVKYILVKFDQCLFLENRVIMLRLFISWKELDFKLIFENGFNVVENEILLMEIKSVQIDEEEKNKIVMGIF